MKINNNRNNVLYQKQEFIEDIVIDYRIKLTKGILTKEQSTYGVLNPSKRDHTYYGFGALATFFRCVPFFIITSPFFYSLYTNENFWSKKGT